MVIKKGDKIVIIVIIIFLLSFALFTLTKTEEEDKKLAVIEINGQEYQKIELFDQMDREEIYVEIKKNHFFRIVAEKGKVKMVESTCPNKICVNTGWISKIGESIICLPYKTAIYIEETRS